MRFSIVAAVAAFSSIAFGQGLDNLPQCAQTCFGGNTGSCGTADIACICGSSVIQQVSCCVFATCSQADIQTTIQFASTFCKLAGVTVNTAPTCASGTSTPSSGNGTVSATASVSGSASRSVSGVTGSASRTASASAAASSGAASNQQSGAGFGLGMAVAGLLAAL
ncbi:hypothetical protein EK21DRAFT_108591 [Setomelanomma holmii]|uniref:CFEM domain-containing protein n=1 Tax=Setomelanomma holmii TaxID=210430 RepID=A0A9P4HIF4_9PLEO|nr:hypothetical protein EK21DRAFT_108591 [Setomelanomma holmii]